MKKSLLITVGLFASLQLHGQGAVVFSNIANWPQAAVIDSTTDTNAVAGTTFSVALYFAPYPYPDPGPGTLPPDPSTFTQVGYAVHLGFLLPSGQWICAGCYDGGAVLIPQIHPSSYFGWFQVKAWESVYGLTYEQAAAAGAMNGRTALLGISNIIKADTGDTTLQGVPEAPAPLTGLSGILLTVVPEPSVVALGALSACVVLVFLSKKPAAAQ